MKGISLILLLFLFGSCQWKEKEPSGTEEVAPLYSQSLRLGGREYVENVLISIFGPSIKEITYRTISKNSAQFGDPCDRYELIEYWRGGVKQIENKRALCHEGKSSSKDSLIGPTGTLRSVWLYKACTEISRTPSAINFAIQSWEKAIVNANTIDRAYQKFYPGQEMNLDLRKKLLALKEWKKVFKVLCLTQEWQVP